MKILNKIFFIVFLFHFSNQFSFAIVTDIHFDLGNEQRIKNAESVVSHLNSIVLKENLKFVFLTGDLTDKGFMFEDIKRVFSKLEVPYVPMLGNHDILKNNRSWAETNPSGDVHFSNLFKDVFQKIPNLTWNDRPVYNPEKNHTSWFPNFKLQHEKIIFFGLDFNSRTSGRPVFNGVVNTFHLQYLGTKW
jgi:hypothetical protein